MQAADEYFTNDDPRLANTDRKKTVTLKDYFMKHFQSALPKPASKSGPLAIEMKTFDKNNPFPYPSYGDEEENDNDPYSVEGNFTNQSNVTDFLDNLLELYKDLCLVRKQKQQFLNLLTYLDNLLVILSTNSKNSGDRSIQIVDAQSKEDNFMIMLMSLGYEITFWSENKILLNISTEPSKEFLSIASNAIRSEYLQNPQFLNQSRPEPTPFVERRPEPVRTSGPQIEAERRADFYASRHEARLQKMNQANTSATVNTNLNSSNRDTRNNRYTDSSYMDSQADEYRNMMRSRDMGPGYNTQSQQGYNQYVDYRPQQPQQPQQSPNYYYSYENNSPTSNRCSEDDQILFGLTVLELTNQFRGNTGAPLLDWCQDLYELATEHSKAMAEGRTPFGHQGFDKRCERSRYPRWSIAENVGANSKSSNPAETAVQGWINSDAHRKNLLSKTDVCGVGCYQGANGTWYFTQIFAQRG